MNHLHTAKWRDPDSFPVVLCRIRLLVYQLCLLGFLSAVGGGEEEVDRQTGEPTKI